MDRELVDLFSNTCLLHPALPRELNRFASKVGFRSTGPEIPEELQSAPNVDLLYFAKLRLDEKVSLSGYFSGPVDRPTVVCTVRSHGVTAQGLGDLIERSIHPYNRTDAMIADGAGHRTNWRFQTKDGEGMLELRFYSTPPRASITYTYQGRNR